VPIDRTVPITLAATSDSPLQKPPIRGWGASDGSPSSGFGIANECNHANVSCDTTGSNIEHGVLGNGAGVGVQAVAGNQLTLEFAADVCITSPPRLRALDALRWSSPARDA
jgi:hypothetical protein